MALIGTQTPTIEGLAPTYTAVTASDTVRVNVSGSVFLIVRNGGTAADTCTVVVPGTTYGQANPDIPVTVPAGGERWIGPLTPDMADPTTNEVTITHSSVTTVTCAAVNF